MVVGNSLSNGDKHMSEEINRRPLARWIGVQNGVKKITAQATSLGISMFILLGLLTWSVWTHQAGHEENLPRSTQSAAISEALKLEESSKLVVPFVKNVGQISDTNVRYSASIHKGAVYVKNSGVVYALKSTVWNSGPESANKESAQLLLDQGGLNTSGVAKDRERGLDEHQPHSYMEAMTLRDAPHKSEKVMAFEVSFGDRSIAAKGRGEAGARVSDFRGVNDKNWGKNIPSHNSLSLGEMWNYVEVALKAHNRNVEQLFFVKPSGNVQDIALNFKGIDRINIANSGELVLSREDGHFTFTKPVAYQLKNGKKNEVEVAYTISPENRVGFKIGMYDRSEVLVIDPLLASTYLGGSNEERFAYEGFGGHIYTGDHSIARDASGNVYVLGETLSNNFPTTAGVYDGAYNDSSSYLKNDITISKFSPGLDTLLASTYLGGTSEDNASALVLDASGNVYITGFTRSMDFPVVNGNHDITFNGGPSDVFVSKLSGDLTQLLASTYLGGRKTDVSYSMTLDGAGHIYVAGDTQSDNFPIRAGGYQTTVSGNTDGFIAKFTTDLTTLSKVTLLGGSNDDYLRSVVRDISGDIYVVGSSASNNFPITGGVYDNSQNLKLDVVVSRLSGDLSTLIASTFLGHSYDDIGYALGVNSDGDILVSGITESASFPTTVGAFDRSHNGTYDIFVSKLGSSLTTLKASTFVGGADWDDVYALDVDTMNQVYIVGTSRSSDYPTTLDAYKRTLNGNSDGIIVKLSANLATVEASTYMGGTGHLDALVGFAFDSAGDLLTVGVTNSSDFPTTPGAYDSTQNGLRELVVFKITKDLLSDTSSNHMTVTTSLGASTASVIAGSSTQITVRVYDQFGNVLPSYNGDYSVTFSGPGASAYGNVPTCTDKGGVNRNFGTATTLTFVKGVASCTMKVYKSEVTAVDASISSTVRTNDNSAWNLDLTVGVGAFSPSGSLLNVTPSPSMVTTNTTLSLEGRDLYGNSVGSAADGKSVVFTITGANPQVIAGASAGSGLYTAIYVPVHSGYDTITATVDGSGAGSDGDGTRDGVFHLTVEALGLDHLEVRYENPPGTFNSSASFQASLSYTITIFARDALGNNVLSYDGWKNITLAGPNVSPYGAVSTCLDLWGIARNVGTGMTLNFTDGKATCSFVPKTREVISLDASDGAANSTSSALYDLDLNVSADTVSHLTATGSSTQIVGSSQAITIRAKDQYGNIQTGYNGDRFLTFSGVPPSYHGYAATVSDKVNADIAFGSPATVTFASGVATSNLVIYTRGVFSVDVTDGNTNSYASADYDLDVTVTSTGVLSQAQSTITSNSNPVGNCGVLVPIVTTRDIYGNQLESGGHTVVVTVSGVNAGAPTVVDNGNGSYFASYPPSNAGTDTITATINGVAVSQDTDGTSDGNYIQILTSESSNTATWLGGTSIFWHDGPNWQGGVVPTSC